MCLFQIVVLSVYSQVNTVYILTHFISEHSATGPSRMFIPDRPDFDPHSNSGTVYDCNDHVRHYGTGKSAQNLYFSTLMHRFIPLQPYYEIFIYMSLQIYWFPFLSIHTFQTVISVTLMYWYKVYKHA